MLLQRVITALILAPLMLAGIYLLPDTGFRIFIGIIVALGAWESANLVGYRRMVSRVGVSVASLLVLVVVHFTIDVHSLAWPVVALMPLLWWLFASLVVVSYPKHIDWLASRPLKLISMIPILGGFWMGLVWLKLQDQSLLLLTWLMLLVWGADVGAYFAGRTFGNRKLAPNVSPGKTWAGVYGGMATSMLVSVLVAVLFLSHISMSGWFWLIALSGAVVAISVMGDLYESLLKRDRGIKDSSALLPGHGGVLDRIDSLSAATPMFVLLWFVLTVI